MLITACVHGAILAFYVSGVFARTNKGKKKGGVRPLGSEKTNRQYFGHGRQYLDLLADNVLRGEHPANLRAENTHSEAQLAHPYYSGSCGHN